MKTKTGVRSFFSLFAYLGTGRRGEWVLALLCLAGVPLVGESAVVNDPSETALRAAMASGGTVQFAFDGTITLTNPITVLTNTVLDGTGHQVTISGGNAVQVFRVETNVAFTLVNLAIANGLSTNGGGLCIDGGVVTATNCTFSGNAARWGGNAPCLGGAICNRGGQVVLQNCGFVNNGAYGAPGQYPATPEQPFAPAADGRGGAIHNTGSLRLSGCTFAQNAATGGDGYPMAYATPGMPPAQAGGAGQGGAIWSVGVMVIDSSLFTSNACAGGSGGHGGAGGPPQGPGMPGPGEDGGNGGNGYGGAIFSGGPASLVNSTFGGNTGRGGTGGGGGAGSDFWWQGVHYHWDDGHPGLPGEAVAAIWSDTGSSIDLTNCTVALNLGSSAATARGSIGGSSIRMINTLLATNSPNNAEPPIMDLGHNLSSDASVPLPGVGSLTNTDPRLGPLADNGGPTLTMALLAESPAIDAADTASAPITDQRGFPRPVGQAADIGAFEFPPTAPTIVTHPVNQTAAIGTTAEFIVVATGSPQLRYQWLFNHTNALSEGTNSVLRLSDVQPVQAGDYRAIVTNLFGAITSSAAVLTVTAQPPTLVVSPSNQTVALASAVTFYASAVGSLPLSYQWFFNATNALDQATNASLTLKSVQLSDSGAYSIRAANAFGAVTSAPAMLIVFGIPPAIVASPRNQAAVVGSNVDFSVSASGSLPLNYQWIFNGTNVVGGATSTALHLEAVGFAQAGLYAVVVSNDFGSVTSSPASLTVTPPGTTAVANPTEAELRAALAKGGRVIFACDGVITLASAIVVAGDTQLDGVGRQVTISGGAVTRIFYIDPGAIFALANLTLSNGLSPNGGALFIDGGTVNATNCIFADNRAVGPAGSSIGASGTPAGGGAIYNNGNFVASQCAFVGNRAAGGRGADGSPVPVQSPPLGGSGAPGNGGALCNLGTAFLERSLMVSNAAAGGGGGMGSAGDYYVGPQSYGTTGGGGGAGAGGALYSVGTAALVNCTLAWNQGAAGNGGAGGSESGPSPYADFGPPGGPGGTGIGGICSSGGVVGLTNCTVASNCGYGGTGGSGGPARVQGPGGSGGNAAGGLSFAAAAGNLVNCVLSSNSGVGGAGGYGCRGPRNNIICGYSVSGDSKGNLDGMLFDCGHNLSSDASSGLTNSTSLNNIDPRLGPLANNGGPILTMALLDGSPAIDGGDSASAPSLDQRGSVRPIGLRADIGAYEYGAPAYLRLSLPSGGGVDILVLGVRGQACWLQRSPNLADWLPVATNQVGLDGTVLIHTGGGLSTQFYRVALP